MQVGRFCINTWPFVSILNECIFVFGLFPLCWCFFLSRTKMSVIIFYMLYFDILHRVDTSVLHNFLFICFITFFFYDRSLHWFIAFSSRLFTFIFFLIFIQILVGDTSSFLCLLFTFVFASELLCLFIHANIFFLYCCHCFWWFF